jgi:methylase of polypeptide subunit release factors
MSPANRGTWTSEPFILGSAEQFSALRDLFLRAGYEEAPLCARAGIESIHDFPRPEDRSAFKDITDTQSLLVRLFLDGEVVSNEQLELFLAGDERRTMESLGLFRTVPGQPEERMATVAIYPIEELYIASDRRHGFDITAEIPPADLVFSPVTRETQRFLRLMPRESCNHLLDLCTGTGIAGLIAASKYARQVTLVDIAERSVRFALFNVALNGLRNVRVLQGDVYAPLGDERFDVVVAHPPYVPALETEFVFRDGGEDGEQVTQRMIAGLPDHLIPGGQFFCECMLTERDGATLEQRLRSMLGTASEDFDLVVAQGRGLDPFHFFADQAKAGYSPFERLAQLSDSLERLGIEQLVFCSLLFQRRSTDRPVITTRRLLSPLTRGADLQWVLRWMVATAGWDTTDSRRLLSSRPRTLPHTELRSRSMLHDGQWSVDECQLVTLAPFAVEASCPNWYATLLQFCDGRMTAREHLQYLRDTHAVPDAAPEDVFAVMIRQLVDAGLVEIDEFRLPDATAMRDTVGVRERATGSGPVERAD